MTIGLQFRKLDLHVHTPASKCFADKSVTDKEIIDAAISRGLSGIAVTDHNTCSRVDGVMGAAKGTGLTVFPGVEISVTGGIHVVAILDVDKTSADINNLLGALGIVPEQQGKPEALCTKSVEEVLRIIHGRGALPILAHIDDVRGAFQVLSGLSILSCRTLFNDAPYVAVETVAATLPPVFSQPDGGYSRKPASYQASDNPDPSDPRSHSLDGIAHRFSFFKLGEVINLEGLRQCFADPEVRIRGMGSAPEDQQPKIVRLTVNGGFLTGASIEFHPGLNSIIGGKGVGKSLIIEIIRFVLDQASKDTAIEEDHKGKLQAKLGPLNDVELEFQLASGTRYLVRRKLGAPSTCYRLDTGEEYGGSIPELFPILAYSQNEIISIASSPDAQLRLVDSFINVVPHVSRELKSVADLVMNGEGLAESILARDRLDDLRRDLSTKQVQLAEIDAALATVLSEKHKLDEYRILETKSVQLRHFLDSFSKALTPVATAISEVAAVRIGDIPAGLEADEDIKNMRQLLADSLERVQTSLRDAEQRARRDCELAQGQYNSFVPILEAAKTEYENVLKGTERLQRLESDRRTTSEAVQALEVRIGEVSLVAESHSALKEARKKLLDQLDSVNSDFYHERDSVFRRIAAQSNGKLKLELQHNENRRRFTEELSSLLRGSRARSEDIEKITSRLMPRDLEDLVTDRNAKGLAAKADITETWAQAIIEKIWAEPSLKSFLRLAHSGYPEDTPLIKFKTSGSSYSPLSELSVGQKCTALLIIALSQGAKPVIVDQPEDALDVTTIWEDISGNLRRGKEKRQFILTTHNPSVAVASDSDVFLVISGTAKKAKVECVGPIENSNVRGAVIQHLEGGEHPYRLRHIKYRMRHVDPTML